MPDALVGDIGQIAMRATDLARATAFYRDTLGLKLALEAPNLAFVEAGDLLIMLGPAEGAEFDHPGSVLYFRTADITAADAALSGRGVAVRGGPHVGHRAGGEALGAWPAGAEEARMPASHKQPGNGTRTVLQVEDCRKTFAELKRRGVHFKDPEPLVEGWGIAADLTDPDGNPFTIYQPAPPAGAQDGATKA